VPKRRIEPGIENVPGLSLSAETESEAAAKSVTTAVVTLDRRDMQSSVHLWTVAGRRTRSREGGMKKA
jgi:hypothetical protein